MTVSAAPVLGTSCNGQIKSDFEIVMVFWKGDLDLHSKVESYLLLLSQFYFHAMKKQPLHGDRFKIVSGSNVLSANRLGFCLN